MKRGRVNRRQFISTISISAMCGLAGCSSSGQSSSGSASTPEPTPTRGEIIEEFSDVYTVGTYQQPDEEGSLEDAQYLGRGSFPVLMPHTAQVEYDIDLSVQDGYDTIPLNVYFVDANNYLKMQENEEFETIDKGTIEPVEEKQSVTFTIEPGVYFMAFGSDTVGRESTFSIDYTSQQYLNYNTSCPGSDINVGHLSLQLENSLANIETWNVRYHIQYDGEKDTEYTLEMKLISSDSEEKVTKTETQVENCKTNFVYSNDESLNIVERGERIIAEIKILDAPDGNVLAETAQDVENIVY